MIVPDSREGVETTFTVRAEDSTNSDCISADFCFYYSDLAGAMEQSCDGKIVVYLGEARKQELPPYGGSRPDLYPIDSDAGYKSFEQNGLGYTGPFRRLQDIQRRCDYAIAMAEWSAEELDATEYTVHPALLDVSRQNVFHARADPAVGNLPMTILPVGIKRVAVSPNVALADGDTLRVKTDTFVAARNGLGVVGDVHIYNASSGDTAVQMESVSLDPVSPQMPHQDDRLFFEIVFKIDPFLRLLEPPEYDLDSKSSQRTKELSADIERLCLFYIQRILADLDAKERPTLMWYHQMLVSAWDATIKLVQEGCNPVAETSWLADKSDIVDKIFVKWGNTVDIEIVRVVGERSLEFLKRKESILEVLMKDNMAARVYSDGCGFEEANGGIIDVLSKSLTNFPGPITSRLVLVLAPQLTTSYELLAILSTHTPIQTYPQLSLSRRPRDSVNFNAKPSSGRLTWKATWKPKGSESTLTVSLSPQMFFMPLPVSREALSRLVCCLSQVASSFLSR